MSPSVKAVDVAGKAAIKVKTAAVDAGDKVKGMFGKVLTHIKEDTKKSTPSETSMITCTKCGKVVTSE